MPCSRAPILCFRCPGLGLVIMQRLEHGNKHNRVVLCRGVRSNHFSFTRRAQGPANRAHHLTVLLCCLPLCLPPIRFNRRIECAVPLQSCSLAVLQMPTPLPLLVRTLADPIHLQLWGTHHVSVRVSLCPLRSGSIVSRF